MLEGGQHALAGAQAILHAPVVGDGRDEQQTAAVVGGGRYGSSAGWDVTAVVYFDAELEVTPPTVAQVEAMARVMPPYIRAAIVTLAGSGLRIGELLGLKVSDVDFKVGTIRVERQRLQSGKIGPPKTVKSGRTVPVGEVVIDALLAHFAARPSKAWLFAMEEGERLDYRRWRTEWNCARRALQAAEDEAAERGGRKPVELPHMVTHDHAADLRPSVAG